jgi:hypothetical protein
LSLDTRIGSATAQSYITAAEADTLLASLPDDTTAWDSLSTAEKEFRLRLASDFIGMLRLRQPGKAYRTQALHFPRQCQTDFGYSVHSIPTEVKEAQAFIAYSVIHRALAQRPSSMTEDSGTRSVKSFSVSGLNINFGELTGGTSVEVFLKTQHWPIYLLLRKFITQVRGKLIPTVSQTLSTTSTTTSTTSTTTT